MWISDSDNCVLTDSSALISRRRLVEYQGSLERRRRRKRLRSQKRKQERNKKKKKRAKEEQEEEKKDQRVSLPCLCSRGEAVPVIHLGVAMVAQTAEEKRKRATGGHSPGGHSLLARVSVRKPPTETRLFADPLSLQACCVLSASSEPCAFTSALLTLPSPPVVSLLSLISSS